MATLAKSTMLALLVGGMVACGGDFSETQPTATGGAGGAAAGAGGAAAGTGGAAAGAGGAAGSAGSGDAGCEPNCEVVLASGELDPRGIALDTSRAYWVNESGGTVRQIEKSGGTAVTVSENNIQPRAVVVDAAWIYWPSNTLGQCVTGLWKQSKAGGSPQVLSKCTDAMWTMYDLAGDGISLYFSSDHGVYRADKDTGALTNLVNASGAPKQIAVNATHVLWTATTAGEIVALDKVSSNTTVVASGQNGANAIAVDTTYAYWTTQASIARAPIAGGSVETLATAQNGPSALAVYQDYVYWANAGDGLIQKVPTQGGSAIQLASGQGGPTSIAVDASGIYWTNASGEVMQRPH